MSDSVVYRNSLRLQSRIETSKAEPEGCSAATHNESHRGFCKEHGLMRLKLMEGNKEVAVLEVASEEALQNQLGQLYTQFGDRLFASSEVQVHLWHDTAWWSLSDDLSQFFTWIVESGAGTLDEARAFTAAPLRHASWLFEAAWQMNKLLEVVTVVQSKETQP